MATMGQSIVFKGELSGDEDLEIEGQVDGIVQLANHQLTIGANGRLKAEVKAKSIIVIGEVTGNLTATERIEIQATGVVSGDLKTPRLNVQEGAVLNGSIEMTGGASASASSSASASASAPGKSDSASTAASTTPIPDPIKPAGGGARQTG
jgi:cytoskeletal protein CcmA (bactofilin family)